MLRCIMREVALGGSTEATVDRQLPQGTGVFKGLDRDGWMMYTRLVYHLIDKEIDLQTLHYGHKSLWHCMSSIQNHFELTYINNAPHVRIKPGSVPASIATF